MIGNRTIPSILQARGRKRAIVQAKGYRLTWEQHLTLNQCQAKPSIFSKHTSQLNDTPQLQTNTPKMQKMK